MLLEDRIKNLFRIDLNSLLDLLDDSVLNARITQDVVWGDAGLPAVGVLPPGDAPASAAELAGHTQASNLLRSGQF